MMLPQTASEIRRAVAAGRATAADICQAALERISALDELIGAFRTVDAERALSRAAELDRRRSELAALPLLGVPVAIKDNICTRALRTTASSSRAAGFSGSGCDPVCPHRAARTTRAAAVMTRALSRTRRETTAAAAPDTGVERDP